jgi:hypothetical protein
MEPHDFHDGGTYPLGGRRYKARHVACRASNGRRCGRLYPLDCADDILHLEYGCSNLLGLIRRDDRPDGIGYQRMHVLVSELRLVGTDPRPTGRLRLVDSGCPFPGPSPRRPAG